MVWNDIPQTNLRMRYCKMVVKAYSWSELSSDRDWESLSSILLEIAVPIQNKISNTWYKRKQKHSECRLYLLRNTKPLSQQTKIHELISLHYQTTITGALMAFLWFHAVIAWPTLCQNTQVPTPRHSVSFVFKMWNKAGKCSVCYIYEIS